MHGAHHDAQKLISTQRPLSDARLSVLPSSVTKLIDGAIEVIGPSPKLCDVSKWRYSKAPPAVAAIDRTMVATKALRMSMARAEARRVGKGGGRTGRSRWRT